MIIAVTTFYQSKTNYGQLLQAWALQQVLMLHGHFPYIIRYGFHEQLEPSLHFEYPKASFDKLQCNRKLTAAMGTADDRGFDNFRAAHLNLSANAYNSLKQIQLSPPLADCYLTGSDQVWAQLLSKKDNEVFYLNFGPAEIRKVAYAPSFSQNKYPAELNDLLALNLKRLDAVSVREKTGVDICRQAGVTAQWTVDPTILLDADYYRMLAAEADTKLPDKYMLVYHVNVRQEDMPCWQSFAKYNSAQGIENIAVHANGEGRNDVEFLSEATYCYPTIQEWIRLADNCQYMLTTSFHGMVFAILLHKKFFVCLRPDSQFAGNDRIFSVLTAIGLQDRIVSNDMDIEQMMGKDIDWGRVDKIMQQLRDTSVDYLKDCLQGIRQTTYEEKVRQWTDNYIDKIKEANEENAKLRNQLEGTTAQWHSEKAEIQESARRHAEDARLQIQALQDSVDRIAMKNIKHLKTCRLLFAALALMTILLLLSLTLK